MWVHDNRTSSIFNFHFGVQVKVLTSRQRQILVLMDNVY